MTATRFTRNRNSKIAHASDADNTVCTVSNRSPIWGVPCRTCPSWVQMQNVNHGQSKRIGYRFGPRHAFPMPSLCYCELTIGVAGFYRILPLPVLPPYQIFPQSPQPVQGTG